MAKVYQLIREAGPDGKIRWIRSERPVAGGRWFLDYADHTGKQVRRATDAQTKAEALALLRVQLGQQARAEAAGVANPRALSMELAGFLDEIYLPHVRLTRRKSTAGIYEGYAELLKERFKRRLLAEITREEVLDFQAWLIRDAKSRHKRPMAPATCNRFVAFLRAVLYDAVARGYIGANPAARIKLLPEENERTRVASTTEERKLFEKLDDWMAPIVRVALLAGLRQGEILRLRRRDVDRDRRQIHVSAEAKDHEARFVPYPAALEATFEQLLPRIGGAEGANPFLFSRSDGAELKADTVKQAFERAVRNAKVHDLHFHDLRRTYASRLVDLGVGLPVIAKLLGHGATYVTERYAHASDQALEAAVALMDQQSDSRNPADAPAVRTGTK